MGVDENEEDKNDEVRVEIDVADLEDKVCGHGDAKRIKFGKADQECYELIKQIQAQELQGGDTFDAQPRKDGADSISFQCEAMPQDLDKEDVEKCLRADDGEDGCDGCNFQVGCAGHSLHDLLAHPSLQEDKKSNRIWLHLWRLLLRLRADNGEGCDASLIKNHRACRHSSGKSNWHQQAEHACRMLNTQSGLSANRVSRMQAWKTVAASNISKVLGMSESDLPQTMHSGAVVLVLTPILPHSWRVATVLSVWMIAGKKTKLTHLPIPVDKVASIRVALMDPVKKEKEGTFMADSLSPATIVPPFRIACELQCESMSVTSQAFQCVLTPESLNAAQRAHLIKQWPKALLDEQANSVPVRTAADPGTPRKRKAQKTTINSPKIDTGKTADAEGPDGCVKIVKSFDDPSTLPVAGEPPKASKAKKEKKEKKKDKKKDKKNKKKEKKEKAKESDDTEDANKEKKDKKAWTMKPGKKAKCAAAEEPEKLILVTGQIFVCNPNNLIFDLTLALLFLIFCCRGSGHFPTQHRGRQGYQAADATASPALPGQKNQKK